MRSEKPIVNRTLGLVLDHGGRAGLPMGLGLLLGYFAADQRIRLVPQFLEMILILFFISTLAIAGGCYLAGKAYKTDTSNAGPTLRLRRRVIFALVLAMGVIVTRLVLFWVEQPSPLTHMATASFERAYAIDSQRYRAIDRGLEQSVRQLENTESLLPSSTKDVLNADQEIELLKLWCSAYEQAFVLDQIRIFYEDYYRFDPSIAQRTYHVRSFLLSYASELSLYEKALRLYEVLKDHKHVTKFLNVPHKECGLSDASFDFLRLDLLGARDQGRVLAGAAYLELMERTTTIRDEVRSWSMDWLWVCIEQHLAVINALNPLKKFEASVRGDLQPLKKAIRRAWYPAQANVAEWMGDTKLRRVGWYLISEEKLKAMEEQLEPGDILVSRKNWYLSNVGLPGFWPHAVLYLGEPKTLDNYFDVPEVTAWVKEQSGTGVTFSAWLQTLYPRAFASYALGTADKTYSVIEAISEGVVFNTLHKAAGDYLGGMRPRLDRLAKAQAIVEAFKYWGRPYDFDFDFATDHALVCTELVWRAYRPREDKKGLDFDLVSVAGRKTLPANDIVKNYARHKNDLSRQLDFICFLDADEKSRSVLSKKEELFSESAKRSKWGELR